MNVEDLKKDLAKKMEIINKLREENQKLKEIIKSMKENNNE